MGEGAFGLVKIVLFKSHNKMPGGRSGPSEGVGGVGSPDDRSQYFAVKSFTRQDVVEVLGMVEQERDVMMELGKNDFIVQLHATLRFGSCALFSPFTLLPYYPITLNPNS